jgi:hypothetical protein
MVEPVILTDKLIDLAVAWRDEYLRQLPLPEIPPVIANATVTSPVDGSSRTIWLVIGVLNAPAKACIGLLKPDGTRHGDGYTIVLDPTKLEPTVKDVTLAMLHEMTHVVDPQHDADCELRANNPSSYKTSQDQYELDSEQRAFSAMWSWHLRERIRAGVEINGKQAVATFRAMDYYFRGFLDDGDEEIWEQTAEHFQRTIDDLKRRHGIKSTP